MKEVIVIVAGFAMLSLMVWQGEKTSQLKLQVELEIMKCQRK